MIQCAHCAAEFKPGRRDAKCCSRKCAKAKSAQDWRDRNRDRHREYSAGYYSAHKAEQYKTSRAWAAANCEKVAAYRRAWTENNPDLVRQSRKRWDLSNPSYGTAKAAARRLAQRTATPHKNNEYHEFFTCEIYSFRKDISDATRVEHHVDHIVPLIHGTVCGLHTPANLRVIPWYENLRKGNKFIHSMAVAK